MFRYLFNSKPIAITALSIIIIVAMIIALLAIGLGENMSKIEKAANEQMYVFIIYIISLALTFFLSSLVWITSNKYQEAIKSDADVRIATAMAVAETAKAEAALANQKAAEANENAESERLVRVKMETDLAPRVLTTTDKEISELSLFSGTGVFILFELYDIEAHRLAVQIGNMLRKAKWNILGITPKTPETPEIEMDNRGNTIIYGTGGVAIFSKRSGEEETGYMKDNNRWNDAARVLCYELFENKIDSVEFSVNPQAKEFPRNFPNEAILVVVGSKPQPYFKDKQLDEIRDRIGIRDNFEVSERQIKQQRERQMEKDFENIPSLREVLEESKQRNESVVDTYERRRAQEYREYLKKEKEKILQKYK